MSNETELVPRLVDGIDRLLKLRAFGAVPILPIVGFEISIPSRFEISIRFASLTNIATVPMMIMRKELKLSASARGRGSVAPQIHPTMFLVVGHGRGTASISIATKPTTRTIVVLAHGRGRGGVSCS